MVAQYRPPNVLLQDGSNYKADIDSSITSVGRIAAAYLPHEKAEIAEVSKVTFVDDVSGNLDGTYFTLSTTTVDFYIWFNATDISGLLDPGLSGATGIRVDFTTDDTAATLVAAANVVIDAQALLNSFQAGDDLTISNRDDGAVVDISDGLSGNATGFGFVVLTQGGDGPDDLSVHIDAGYVLDDAATSGNNGLEEIAAQIIPEGSGSIVAPSSFPRIDRIVVDLLTGVAELVGGAEAASPVAPDIPSGKAPNCQFRLETSSIIITDTLIIDERALIVYGPSTGATFINAILTNPFITDFTNASHDHSDVAGGGDAESVLIKPQILADSAKTFLVGDMNKIFVITPTTSRILTLPTTSVIVGDIIEIHNIAVAQKITIEASGGNDIAIFQDGMMRLVCISATPTTRAHWRILEVAGGASPSFGARPSANQTNVTGNAVKVFDTEDHDNNANYNNSTNEFTPTVPGRYQINTHVTWDQVNLSANDQINLILRKNLATVAEIRWVPGTTGRRTANSVNGVFLINTDLSDQFDVLVGNDAINTGTVSLGNLSGFSGHRVGN